MISMENFSSHKLIFGDCRKVLKTIPEESIHLIITSPPYNLSKGYGKWKDNLPFEEYLKFTEEWLRECYRVLVNGGRICVDIPVYTHKNNGNQNLLFHFLRIMKEIGFKERELILWIKMFGLDLASSYKVYGTWSPKNPSMDYPSEVIIVMNKNDRNLDGKLSDLTKYELIKWRRNVWFITPGRDRTHPAPFPEEIPRRLIKIYSFVGQTVMDVFVGSGTTTKVANELTRNSIGIEINEDFLPLIKGKIEVEKNKSKFEIVNSNGNSDFNNDRADYQIEILTEKIKDCLDNLNVRKESPISVNWKRELDRFFGDW